jgi:hypothetical protein
MENLTIVEVVGAPDQANRFVTCPRLVYTDLTDIAWGPSKKGILRDKNGNWRSLNSIELNRKIVDDFRARVKAGTAVAWIGTARVSEYMPSRNEFKSVYEGPEEKKVITEPDIPTAFLAVDGTWRLPPTAGFSKGPRFWSLAVAHVDRKSNQAYSSQFTGVSKLEVLQKLFDPMNPAWVLDLVTTYRLADPSQIPQPVAPVVEVPLTAAEIEAIEPYDYEAYTRIPAAQYKRDYIMSERFRVSIEKMFSVRQMFEEKMRLKQEAEANQAAIDKAKKQYQRDDANELFKTGGIL